MMIWDEICRECGSEKKRFISYSPRVTAESISLWVFLQSASVVCYGIVSNLCNLRWRKMRSVECVTGSRRLFESRRNNLIFNYSSAIPVFFRCENTLVSFLRELIRLPYLNLHNYRPKLTVCVLPSFDQGGSLRLTVLYSFHLNKIYLELFDYYHAVTWYKIHIGVSLVSINLYCYHYPGKKTGSQTSYLY
jgi:hypothetical protein